MEHISLFIDGRYIRTDFHDGISRFSASLISAMQKIHPVTVIISDKKQLNFLPAGIDYVEINSPTSVTEPLAAKKLNKFNPDVVFSPMQTIGSMGRNFGLILTLHDLIYYQHRTPPRNLPQFVRGLWYVYHSSYTPQRLLLNGADAIATVSNTTRQLMIEHRLTKRPIQVISNAPQKIAEPRDPIEAPEKSLVYMGSFMEYKNVELLIDAMAKLPEYRLHLCSKITDERKTEYLQRASSAGVETEQLIFHNGLSDEEYQRLLRRTTALVTMSRSEGYGLPIAEAMANGTPVIVSDIEIFHEIAGDDGHSAIYVDPDSPEATDLIAQAAENFNKPENFVIASQAAVENAQRYDWDDSAKTLLDLAQRVHRFRQRQN